MTDLHTIGDAAVFKLTLESSVDVSNFTLMILYLNYIHIV